MNFLQIDASSKEAVHQSFDKIADQLFNNYKLQVNDTFYRIIDLEFYFLAGKEFQDVHTHKHDTQLQNGKWYFHRSGIDLTIGDGINHYGGILIRGIAKFAVEPATEKIYTENIHGPVNVKTELCSNLYGAFEDKPNYFRLVNIERELQGAFMKPAKYTIKSKRIGLTSKAGDADDVFLNGDYRYQTIFDGIIFDYPNKEAIIRPLLAANKMYKEEAKSLLTYDLKL